MKSRKMILSGAILAILVAMLTFSSVQSVLAGESDIGAGPIDEVPQVYLIKKVLDICDPDKGGALSGSDALPGGSIPPSGEQFGCVPKVKLEGAEEGKIDVSGDRFAQYLFTGEQLGVLVAVRHTNGADAIAAPVVLEVDGEVKSLCNDITSRATKSDLLNSDSSSNPAHQWYGHDVKQDLTDQPPAKSAGTITGFDTDYDKLYQCQYTATSDDSGSLPVEVVAHDEDGDEGRGGLDFIWFNPEILVDVTTSDGGPIAFADGSSGQTVYSTNHLIVTNEAEGGVILYVWLAGTDLVSSEGPAKCPYDNTLNVDEQMEYRCKIGSLFNNPWTNVPNPDDTKKCDNAEKDCQGAKPVLPNFDGFSFLTVGSWAECWFRLEYPTPCIGLFDEGQILIYARAI